MHLRKFLALMFSDWLARMSGPLTVPFTVAAFFVSSTAYRILFGVLGAIAAVATCYRLWAKEYVRAEAEQQSRVACEKRLNDEAPKIIFGLLYPMDWTALDSSGEFVFSLTNCGKRPATFVHNRADKIGFRKLHNRFPNGRYSCAKQLLPSRVAFHRRWTHEEDT